VFIVLLTLADTEETPQKEFGRTTYTLLEPLDRAEKDC